MEELKIKIPQGCEGLSVRVEDGKIITEFSPKYEPNYMIDYRNALEKLGREEPSYLNQMPKNERAYHILGTIADSWNKIDGFVPKWSDRNQEKWYPWFKILGGIALGGSYDGLACVGSDIRFLVTAAHIGSRLCFVPSV